MASYNQERSLQKQLTGSPNNFSLANKTIALVMLPGSDTSNASLDRISSALSDKDNCIFINLPHKDVTFKEINIAIINSGADYVFLLNNVYKVSSGFDVALVSELEKNPQTGIVGIPSYYSPISGRSRANLIKQEGLYTEKRSGKKYSLPHYSIKARNSLKPDWLSQEPSSSEVIPSTDFVAMSIKTFKEIGGFSDFYNTNYMTFPLSDLCLNSSAIGHDNKLLREAICAANFVNDISTDDKRQNREVFRGRWFKYLSGGADIKSSKSPLDPLSIDICGPMPDNDSAKSWGDYHFALALKKAFEKMGYKANILSREHWYDKSDSKYVLVLRGMRPYYKSPANYNQILMYWTISHPAEITPGELKQADYVFYPSKLMQDHFESSVSVPSSILPQCTDPEIMHAEGTCSMTPELLFIGNSRHVFRRILKDLLPTEHELQVYGREWDEYPMVKEHLVAEYFDNSKIADAYHNAAILLNDHWDDMLEYGIISNRIFDALSSGAFVISDEVAGIHQLLGDSVVTYKDQEDLKSKINYYLEHKDERDEIASRGHDIVINNHTFDTRAAHIIEKMGQF